MFSYARKSVIMQYTTTTTFIYFRSNRQDPLSFKKNNIHLLPAVAGLDSVFSLA